MATFEDVWDMYFNNIKHQDKEHNLKGYKDDRRIILQFLLKKLTDNLNFKISVKLDVQVFKTITRSRDST